MFERDNVVDDTSAALKQPDRRGIFFALAAAALFGASSPFAKLLLRDTAPQMLAGLLYVGSGTGLALVWFWRRLGSSNAPDEARLSRSDWRWLAGAIVAGGVLGPVLLMAGLVSTPATSASLLLNLEGVFTATIAWFVFHENVDRRVALGFLTIVIGSLVLSWEGPAAWGGIRGPLAVALACLAWGIDNNLTQRVSASDPVQIAMLKGLAAGVVNVTIAAALGMRLPPAPAIGGAFVVGFLGYGVSLALFVVALRHLGTARTGAYFSVAPFFGAALSMALLGERPSTFLLVGGALMAVGVWLHVTERHSHEHRHDAMEHAHRHVHDEHHRHEHDASDAAGEPHTHWHRHEPIVHTHPHYPDIHHRHGHE